MANEEQLAILKQGVVAWNEWKKKNRDIQFDFYGANLSGLNLEGTDFLGVNLSEANLYKANLVMADLRGADLSKADMILANLVKANLQEANLKWARLGGANLGDSNLIGVDLTEADLTAADLRGADLRWANLNGVNLYTANLEGAYFAKTVIGYVDLSTVQALDKVVHLGPSSLGIDTIFKSKGEISEIFLRSCGVPEELIVTFRGLLGKAIEFYSCFISYSSKDEAFAKRVHADLQSKGVRVWFAPEDLKIGDKFRTRIDEAIKVYDKLIVVLSENSIDSDWVESEVEAAFEKEKERKKPVLFPIRLDDAVMKTSQAWAAKIRRERHIGDFSKWKEHDSYQAGFERLLRDLKAGAERARG